MSEAARAAASFIAEADSLPVSNVPSIRTRRRHHSRALRGRPAAFVLAVAQALVDGRRYRWVGYELIRFHRAAFDALTDERVAALAAGLDSWDGVDAFGRILSGPAWSHGLISDAMVDQWSRSPDRWLRRAALVTAIELRDTRRVLALGARLAGDHDDMVVKAMSWMLRELSKRDAAAVRTFLAAHDTELAARVKREVGHKLVTGLKNPRKT